MDLTPGTPSLVVTLRTVLTPSGRSQSSEIVEYMFEACARHAEGMSDSTIVHVGDHPSR